MAEEFSRDLKTYADIGMALWADPVRCRSAAVETLSAISLLDLSDERAVERASLALLDRAAAQGSASHTSDELRLKGFQPFYRLTPRERFILASLHLGRWSYARIARALQCSSEEIEAAAWSARTQIGLQYGMLPVGSTAGAYCPEYLASRPWTQRFLDDEMPSGKSSLFLQNHLMACDSCRRALSRCREIYFKVDELLPRSEKNEGFLDTLERVLQNGRKMTSTETVTFGDSLRAFFAQKNVQIFFALAFAVLVYRMTRR